MKINLYPLSLAAALLVAGCSSMKVSCEMDADFDFGAIRTYQWIDGPQEILEEADTHLDENIRNALDTELIAKGLLAGSPAPDIQVAYYVKLLEEAQYTDRAQPDDHALSGGFVYSRETRDWTYAQREPDLNHYVKEMAILTVLISDSKTDKVVWHGSLRTDLGRDLPAERQMERIRDAAQTLLARLPLPVPVL